MHGKLLDHLWIFSPPNSTVLFIHVPIKLKMRLIAEDDFLRKITIDLLMLQYPIGECTALRMVCWLQFLYIHRVFLKFPCVSSFNNIFTAFIEFYSKYIHCVH
ncbi:hypothetical protein ALC56_01198 [Trachymyrmex septentrionalis]|uniref:Uncharacterized protein n=1 Tax=Trachymyrmex septentrionalis TaxID=34720 RepID=A0A151K0Q1_9HYME|nr:hypothetical protein ALC56_01198 [Trachymyrmex septentrionalis]